MFDRILTNCRVWTLDPSNPEAGAIALRAGRIAAVGAREELLNGAARDTAVDDLGGGVVLPGFEDAHLHLQWTARFLQQVNLMNVPSKEETLRLVAERAAEAPADGWLQGSGWAQGPWEGGEFPTAGDIDTVVADRPVALRARSGHALWVNSLALRIAGIDERTEDPPGGEILRGADGRPTGMLLETAADLVANRIPKPTVEQLAEWMLHAQQLAWKSGLTAIQDLDGPLAFEAMQLLRQRGQLGLRIVKHINDTYIHHAYGLGLKPGLGDEWLSIGALKFYADGALGPVSALMIDPYEGQPDNYGMALLGEEEMLELAIEGTRRGFASAVHAIGDLAVRRVLDVFEKVRAEEARLGIPRDARRHRIEHLQLVHPDDVHRCAELDVIASIQPIHGTEDYPMADRYWGERARLSYNARVQLDAGARVAFGSDSPVERFEPLHGIHAAVTRRRLDGSPGPEGWYPEARLTVEEAVEGFTRGAAYSAGLEKVRGTLAPGFVGDLVVLDRDPREVDPHEIAQLHVRGTMTGGVWRFGEWAEG